MSHTARTPEQIGALLGRQRYQAKLTQKELGDKAGLRQATISKLEAGSPNLRLETLCSVLAALDLELAIVPRQKSSSADMENIF